ncbi:hypothetical protein [Asanoa siamensis]|uniref:Right handed beta helix region n=1 Tax=Asanoa siamensis TaxID=926357 RepID=A0ABQ4CSP6_9ACTN|nr:hypothetical protein [Asanoa siamensis]GIF74286.1 hypothetical protein Asi02nite_38040 [Asanoa siamensis]
MRVRRGLAVLAGSLVTLTGLPVVGATAAAAADLPPTIHVSDNCFGMPADGSESRPYCRIADAVRVVQPGQTIEVDDGVYAESVVVPSGEPGKPITISGFLAPGRRTKVQPGTNGPAFVVSGVHDVVIDGIDIGTGATDRPGVLVADSSDITIVDGAANVGGAPAVEITGDSHRVTVSGMLVGAVDTTAFAVGPRATDTLLTGNSLAVRRSAGGPSIAGITVIDAPDTTITNNTVVTDCLTGIAVSGASGGFALYNSILTTTLPGAQATCGAAAETDPASVRPLAVAGSATTDSHLDYNLIDTRHGGPLYSWGDATFATPAAFNVATGQGAHDIGADPRVTGSATAGWTPWHTSPAIDSGLARAPGIRARDLRGLPHADSPAVANSGDGFVDRGALEYVPDPKVTATITRAVGGGAFETLTTATVTYLWPFDGPLAGAFSFQRTGFPAVVSSTGQGRITFDRAGKACVSATFSASAFRFPAAGAYQTPCMILGAAYNSVTPQRVLDTRSALGVGGTAPVAPFSEIEFSLPGAAATASAVVLNVTATQSSASGQLTVYPSDGVLPLASNVSFGAGQTMANLVTVQVRNGRVRILNGSRGTTHVLADLAGYYANTGAGLEATPPARVLDTRSAPGGAPVPANGRVTVDLSARVPAGTTAAVLNLTVTEPTKGGLFTAYPPGAEVPTASNINFVAGQTVNNMVLAPVVGGKVAFAHTGSGTAHLLVDLAGWFAPGAHDTYLPTAPTRVVDTRTTGTPVGPGQTVRVFVNTTECGTACPPRSAVVANLTATDADRSGYLSVYPFGEPRPTQSVLNFAAGRTGASLVTVGLGAEDSFLVYNGGKGTVHVLVDQAGFYLGAG